MDLEVGVPRQVVGEEANADGERHDLRGQGHELQLVRVHEAPGGLQPAGGQGLVQIEVHAGEAQVLLVLLRGRRGEANQVPEVVEGPPRHAGVEVDDAAGHAGGAVEQHVVELGVAMDDANGDPALLDPGLDHVHQVAPVQDEAHLLRDRGRSSAAILAQGRHELPEAVAG